jgi:flagellar biosynthesis chaperone FliJ
MDNKFSQIVKVRKQQMDKIETLLIQTRFKKQEIEQKIDSLYEEINNSQTPQNGSVSLICLFHENLKVLRREKDDYTDALIFLQERITQLQNEYKKAHLEFEKIKYLEEQEVYKQIQKRKKEEKMNMDEIATLLYSNKKGAQG